MYGFRTQWIFHEDEKIETLRHRDPATRPSMSRAVSVLNCRPYVYSTERIRTATQPLCGSVYRFTTIRPIRINRAIQREMAR